MKFDGPYIGGGHLGNPNDSTCPDCNARLTCPQCNAALLPLIPMDETEPIGFVCADCLRRNADEQGQEDEYEQFRGGEGYVGGAFRPPEE